MRQGRTVCSLPLPGTPAAPPKTGSTGAKAKEWWLAAEPVAVVAGPLSGSTRAGAWGGQGALRPRPNAHPNPHPYPAASAWTQTHTLLNPPPPVAPATAQTSR